MKSTFLLKKFASQSDLVSSRVSCNCHLSVKIQKKKKILKKLKKKNIYIYM